ncbi:hypothetical protein AOLI_G00285350 [Acnodon oligacanthus]
MRCEVELRAEGARGASPPRAEGANRGSKRTPQQLDPELCGPPRINGNATELTRPSRRARSPDLAFVRVLMLFGIQAKAKFKVRSFTHVTYTMRIPYFPEKVSTHQLRARALHRRRGHGGPPPHHKSPPITLLLPLLHPAPPDPPPPGRGMSKFLDVI